MYIKRLPLSCPVLHQLPLGSSSLLQKIIETQTLIIINPALVFSSFFMACKYSESPQTTSPPTLAKPLALPRLVPAPTTPAHPFPSISCTGSFQPTPHLETSTNPAAMDASLAVSPPRGPRPDVPQPGPPLELPRSDVPGPHGRRVDYFHLLSLDEHTLRGEVLRLSQLLNHEEKLHDSAVQALNETVATCRNWGKTAAHQQMVVTHLRTRVANLGTQCQHLSSENYRLKLTLNHFVR